MHPHHHHHHEERSERSSSVEEIVRISRTTMLSPDSPPQRIRVLTPTTISIPRNVVREDRYRHHHHPHLHLPNGRHLDIPHPHHLHLPHPHHLHLPHGHHLHLPHGHNHHHHDTLHGPGRKRVAITVPRPPPSSPDPNCEPIYRTQVVEPSSRDIRETTRIALREVRPDRQRGRLRRVAGYEVLGRNVPWSWDAVSSVGSKTGDRGSSVGGREGARKGLRFPPFGGAGSWM